MFLLSRFAFFDRNLKLTRGSHNIISFVFCASMGKQNSKMVEMDIRKTANTLELICMNMMTPTVSFNF